ncbi:hypothetical protein QTQ03_19410 [Micromonospora sp. WMMA1363]|uniref:hypothetical protein n=1 Tax=Micromonospora sp. WMMA1363 TaxID=3053985 RepID=UPI00259CCA08|nr:hypothetical protein [Micromonospora sp. WMMA1363]MDM4721652.1 hypothetical protein [Micromonospora sp. WMMA1363]
MARRGWGGSITTALGVAAGVAAAQLGVGYGLGIINWAAPSDQAAAAAWTASLIWATWIAATSTVLGAVCAQRLAARGPAAPGPGTRGVATVNSSTPVVVDGSASSGTDGSATAVDDSTSGGTAPVAGDPPPATRTGSSVGVAGAVDIRPAGGMLGRIALAVTAGFGALITVLLVAVPARVATVPDIPAPRNVAAGYAALGVLIGVMIAVWTLHSQAAATNVIATVGWLWLLAAVAVVDGVLAGRGLTSAQLGIWQLSAGGEQLWIRDWFYWPGALLSLGSALVIGVLAARRTARDVDRRVGATASGAAGPLLVAVAYFLAVPGLTAIDPGQVSAHLIAPYAVIVGLGGSVLVATLGQRASRRAAVRVPRQRTASDAVAGAVTRRPTGGPADDTGALGTADSAPGGPARSDSAPGGPAAGGTVTGEAGGSADAEPSTSAGDATGGARRGRAGTARAGARKATTTDRPPAQRASEFDGTHPRGSTAASDETNPTDGGGTAGESSTRGSGRRTRSNRPDR